MFAIATKGGRKDELYDAPISLTVLAWPGRVELRESLSQTPERNADLGPSLTGSSSQWSYGASKYRARLSVHLLDGGQPRKILCTIIYGLPVSLVGSLAGAQFALGAILCLLAAIIIVLVAGGSVSLRYD